MDVATSRSYSRPIWISWDSLTSDSCLAPVAGFVAQAAHAARRPAVTLRPPGCGREGSMGALLSIDNGWVRYTDDASCKPKAASRRKRRDLLSWNGTRGRPKGAVEGERGGDPLPFCYP